MPAKAHWGKTPWSIHFHASRRRLPEYTDFAVIGGGFTGLSAAATLKRLMPKKSVLLVEAGRIGDGASGRTGGMALAQSAAGNLPGLGDVLKGYRKVLRELGVEADLALPGVWEVARGERSMEGKAVRPLKHSPIDWQDSGRLRAVGKVPGGTVDPGKVVEGLARVAAGLGAEIFEEARVLRIEFGNPVRLVVSHRANRRTRKVIIRAGRVLVAANAGLPALGGSVFAARTSLEPKLTFAIATAPLRTKQLAAIGMASPRPFYTADLPYLWGRRMKNGGMIFGCGLVPGWGEALPKASRERGGRNAEPVWSGPVWSGLEKVDARRGDAAKILRSLEKRVRSLHPALKNVRVTHRWGGPILITPKFVPVFRAHPKSKNIVVLGGFSGHGVAQSVYLGKWAAEHLAGERRLPRWR